MEGFMEIKNFVRIGASLLTPALILTSPLVARDPKAELANWDNLKALKQGQEIQVVLSDAKAHRGRFVTVNDEGIAVSLDTGDATFERHEVLRVSYKSGSHRLRNAGIGAAIGGGIGAAAGVGSCSGSVNYCTSSGHEQARSFPLFGIGIGAAVRGLVIPPSPAFRVIYRAR
jgi:hypothetical protein